MALSTVSYEASVTLSQFPPIIERVHSRVLRYYCQHDKSHSEAVLDLAASSSLDLKAYSTFIPVKEFVHPARKRDISIFIKKYEEAVNDLVYADKGYTRIFTNGLCDSLNTSAVAVTYEIYMKHSEIQYKVQGRI